MAKTQMLICPYCGEAQPLAERCRMCRGFFEPLSRQATHNSMGPWYIRDPKRPHRPGCSYETMVRLVERGQIDRFSIIRGPTTRQFWAVAKRVAGISQLLGYCHNCDAHVEPTSHGCPKCGVPFGAFLNRNHLGLPDIRPLPWEAELDLDDRRPFSGNGNGEAGGGYSGGAVGAPKRNVGISSFATDEELTGASPVGPPAVHKSSELASDVTSRSVSSAVREEPEFVDVPGEEPGLSAEPKAAAVSSSPSPVPVVETDRMARTLRATVIRQRKTIRMLTIAVLAVALLSVAFSVLMIRTLSGDDAQAGSNDNGSRSESTHPGETPLPVNSGSSNIGQDSAQVPTVDPVVDDNGPPAKAAPKEQESASNKAKSALSASAQAALDGIDAALQLLEASRDETRSLDDRISDCEQAVILLETAERDVPATSLPADFVDTLKRARTDLERLRLNKFFP